MAPAGLLTPRVRRHLRRQDIGRRFDDMPRHGY